LTTRDYIRIAHHLNHRRLEITADAMPGFTYAVSAIADALAEDSDRFDRDRFSIAVYGGAPAAELFGDTADMVEIPRELLTRVVAALETPLDIFDQDLVDLTEDTRAFLPWSDSQ
jgi:hypothetical protein